MPAQRTPSPAGPSCVRGSGCRSSQPPVRTTMAPSQGASGSAHGRAAAAAVGRQAGNTLSRQWCWGAATRCRSSGTRASGEQHSAIALPDQLPRPRRGGTYKTHLLALLPFLSARTTLPALSVRHAGLPSSPPRAPLRPRLGHPSAPQRSARHVAASFAGPSSASAAYPPRRPTQTRLR